MLNNSYWSSVLQQRITRRRAIATTGAAAAGTALLAACGGGSSGGGGDNSAKANSLITQPADTSKQAVKGGTILDSRNSDISNFDPHNTQSGGGASGSVNFYHQTDALFLRVQPGYLQPADWTITGDLAESWEWSADGLSLTMKRRPFGWAPMPASLNPAMTSGRAITMDDVKWTMDRFFKEGSNRSDYLNSLNPNAPVTNITYPDDNTMVWHLAFPQPGLTAIMASTFKQSYLMPVEAEKYDIKKTPACCGAFYISDYEPSTRMQLKRNPNSWMADRVYVDGMDLPIILEYAAGLAQFHQGNLERFAVHAEDVLQTKSDVPQLLLYSSDFAASGASMAPGWSATASDKTPFRDIRVRQAYSMSTDRDSYLDAWYNVSSLQSSGYPIETRWNTSLTADWVGYWLDPKDTKNFGDNAKYYQHDIATAKQLLSAAGYPNGLDVVATYPVMIYGPDHVKSAQILIAMALDAGIRISSHIANDFNEWPPYRDNHGDFGGIIYRVYGASSQADPVELMYSEMVPYDGNLNFSGFDANGKGDFSGDPTLTDMLKSARLETNQDQRKSKVKDIQRYWAKQMYTNRGPGGATGLSLAWPALKNNRVYQGGTFGDRDIWIDPTLPPVKKA